MINQAFSPLIIGPTPRLSILPMELPGKERKAILVVDYDESARRLLRLAFKSDPYQLWEATDGEMALQMCVAYQPDLILLNIALPRADGITVLQQIRQINQQAIILIVSAMNMQNWIEEAFAKGADGFIAKPFSLLAMRQMVAHLLDQNISKRAPVDLHYWMSYGGKPLDTVRPSNPTHE